MPSKKIKIGIVGLVFGEAFQRFTGIIRMWKRWSFVTKMKSC